MESFLATFIIAVCGLNATSNCTNYYVNCAVDKQGNITQEKLEECRVRYETDMPKKINEWYNEK